MRMPWHSQAYTNGAHYFDLVMICTGIDNLEGVNARHCGEFGVTQAGQVN